MSANIYWRPVITDRFDVDTWRPSSLLAHLVTHFDQYAPYRLGQDDVGWLKHLDEEMGQDGGGHREARQLLAALELHKEIIIEVES